MIGNELTGSAHQHGFLVTDVSGRILYVNELLCRISRRERVDLVGRELDAVRLSRFAQLELLPIFGRGGELLGNYGIVRLIH